jgi:hypothetical protein
MDLLASAGKFRAVVTSHGSGADNGNFHGCWIIGLLDRWINGFAPAAAHQSMYPQIH